MSATSEAARASADRPAGPSGRSVVWHLFVYAAAVALPILLVVGYLLWQVARAEQRNLDGSVRAVAQTMASDLDGDIETIQAMLVTLAASPALGPVGDLAAFARQAQAVSALPGVTIVLRAPDGRVLLDGAGAAPAESGLLDVHRQVLEARAPAVSNLKTGFGPLRHAALVVAPALEGERVTALVEAVMPVELVLRVLQRNLPAHFWAASFVDGSGVLVTRTRNPQGSTGVPATPDLLRALEKGNGTWVGPSHEGNKLLGGFALSRRTGWHAAVGVEHDVLIAPLRRLLAVMGGVTVLAAALSLVMALGFGRSVAGPILDLAQLAGPIRKPGEAAWHGAGRLREVNVVGEALSRATAELADRNAALIRSEETLQVGMEVAGFGVIELDYVADTALPDARAARMFGLAPDSVVPRAELHARIHPEDAPGLLAQLGELLGPDGAGFLGAEYRVTLPDGSVRWIMGRHKVSYATGPDGARRAAQGLLAVQDVTERKRAEEQVVAGYGQIQAIYDAAPIGLCVLDRDGRFLRINRRLAEYNGIPAHLHIGRNVREIVPGLAAQASELKARVFETGEPIFGIELVGETAAAPGVQRVFLENMQPLHDSQGRIYGVSLVVEEVTERRAAEAALAAAAERFRATAEAVPGLMWVGAADGGTILVNAGFSDYAGAAAEQLTADGWMEAIHPDDLEAAEAVRRETVERGQPSQTQCRFRRHDGEWRWHLVRSAPQKAGSGVVTQ